jgi:hypothetical protein
MDARKLLLQQSIDRIEIGPLFRAERQPGAGDEDGEVLLGNAGFH